MRFKILALRIDNYASWVLLAVLLTYVVSGYGMTKGIISYRTANWLHFDVLPWPLFLTLFWHVGVQLQLKLVKWRQAGNRLLVGVVYGVLALLLAYFAVLELGLL